MPILIDAAIVLRFAGLLIALVAPGGSPACLAGAAVMLVGFAMGEVAGLVAEQREIGRLDAEITEAFDRIIARVSDGGSDG